MNIGQQLKSLLVFTSKYNNRSSKRNKKNIWALIEKNLPIQEMTRKEFMDKFFDLCKDAQEEIPPNVIAEILRDYADRLD